MENDISIRSAQINARVLTGIEAATDRDLEMARKYLDDVEAGKLGIVGKTSFLDGIRTTNLSTQSSNTIIQLIELQQYLKASWFNELGLNVNFNMKREYMSEEEIAVNTDILLPLVDDMLKCREEACELINKTFNLNISVRKSSAWANKEQEDLAALAEASNEGGIPLDSTISEKIEEVDTVEVAEKTNDILPEVQEEQTEQQEVSEPEAGDVSDGEKEQGDESARAPDVRVDVNIEVKEVGVDESSDTKLEASEKSEKPASE